MLTIPVNAESILTALATAGVIFLGRVILKSVQATRELTTAVHSIQPPGVLGRLDKVEAEQKAIREWCIAQGFDRRT